MPYRLANVRASIGKGSRTAGVGIGYILGERG